MKRTKLISMILIFIILFSTFYSVLGGDANGENGGTSNRYLNKDCEIVLNDQSLEDFFNKDSQEYDGSGKLPYSSGSQEIPESLDLREFINIRVKDQEDTRIVLGI